MYIKLFLLLLLFTLSTGAQTESNWPLDKLDTARDIPYLSEDEKDVVLEINKVRYNPAQYAKDYMMWMKPFYKNEFLEIPGKIANKTEEGIEAYEECIEALKIASPAPILKPSAGMSKACELLVYDQSSTGETGHRGSGNSSPADRVNRFGTFYGYFGENIHYGDTEPRFSVISLLIDDGVKNRGHRKTILNPEFNYIGVAIGKHKVYKGMCVTNYATEFKQE